MTAIAVLTALTPLIALLSGMAMTPVLLLLTVLVAWQARRAGPLWAGASPEVRALALILGLFLVWPIMTAIWSIAPERSLWSGTRIAVLMAFGGAAYVLVQRLGPASIRLPAWFAGCIAFCAIVLALELLPGGGLLRRGFEAVGEDYDRFIIKNVNRGLCTLAVLVWPAVAGLWARGWKAPALILPWLLLLPMQEFESLSAVVGLLAGAAVFVALLAAPKMMSKVIAVVVPAFFVVWPALFPVLDRAVFSTPAVYAQLPDTAQHRVEVWRFSMTKVAERPLLGWGLEASRYVPGGNDVYAGERKYLPMHSHNSAIQILLEVGAIGLLLTAAALALVMRRWLALENLTPGARATSGAAIVAYLAVGFSAFGLWQYWWLAVGWLAAVIWTMVANPDLKTRS